ncbi:MAG TPA: sigma-70 family RNA polymerase sigma factor [Xanthobacteraceae bacterium]|nr:sigma-70 family RNA polymerase sigma factor [Xanthobacteraceae bacterium]
MARRFDERRPHMQAIAYRMLGSFAEAEEAVQDAWLRVSRADAGEVENLDGWLTTIVGRVCLNLLRARRVRAREAPLVHLPDPVVTRAEDPEQDAILADSVGLALLVVLDTLAPAERLAFVMHDMFDLPFDEIGRLVGRSPAAARQLASRARRRVRGTAPPPGDHDVARQREVVDAFFAAARDGRFEDLVSLLDPQAVLRTDGGAARPQVTTLLLGASAIAQRALQFARPAESFRPVLVNGAAGVVVLSHGVPFSVMSFTIVGRKIVEIDTIADPERLRALDLTMLDL